MHALRFFALTFTLLGSALFLSSSTRFVQAKVEDDAVMLVNIYGPTSENPEYTVEQIPVHGVAYMPAHNRIAEELSLAVLFIVIGYGLHIVQTRTPLRSIHWKKYLRIPAQRRHRRLR